MNSILLSLAALLVLALSALFAVPHFVDWNSYRDVFEAQAAKLIGRDVEVGGNVRLTLLPVPVLRFEDVYVANAAGEADATFASADSFTVWLSVPPLLRGTIQAREIEIDKPVLNLSLREDGSGNWQNIGRADARFPFMARTVTLDLVKIADAHVQIRPGAGAAPLRLEGLSGALTARSLAGPYKFAGTFRRGETEHELRFSTSRREEDGSVRLKAVVRDLGGRATYLLNGSLDGFADVPKFDGDFRFRIATPAAKPGAEGVKGPKQPPVELKSRVIAGLNGAEFQDMELTIRHQGKPQTLRGQARADWRAGLAVSSTVKTRWLDLDALLATAGGASTQARSSSPVAAAGALAAAALDRVPQAGKVTLRVAIEQAVLGGDVVKDLAVEAVNEGANIRLKWLAAEISDDNALETEGLLRLTDKGPAFTGPARLKGRRLSRLLRWAGIDPEAIGAAQAADFSLNAQVTAAPGQLVFDEARGDLLGTKFTGSFGYRTGERRTFVLELDSDRLDLAKVLGADVAPGDLIARLIGWGDTADAKDPKSASTEPPPPAENAPAEAAPWFATADARIDMRVGAVSLPGLGDAKLTAKLHLKDGNLNISTLDLRGADGLTIRGAGKFADLAATPEGRLSLAVEAPGAKDVEFLAALLNLPQAAREKVRLAALTPVKLAATLENDTEAGQGLKATIGGALASSNARVTIRHAGKLDALATGPLEVVARMSNSDGKALLHQIFPRLTAPELARFGPGRGVFAVTLRGTPDAAFDAKVTLDAAGVQWVASGEATFADSGLGLEGQTTFKTFDIAAALALAGLAVAPEHEALAVDSAARVTIADSVYTFEDIVGRYGERGFTGRVQVDRSGKRTAVDANLSLVEASLPHLLAPAIAWDAGSPGQALAVPSSLPGATYWPDRSFNIALLAEMDGRLRLDARQLRLAGAMVLADAGLDARLERGRLTIPKVEGKIYGGKLTASAELAKRGGGVSFLANATAKGLRLEKLSARRPQKPLARGAVDLQFSVTGDGLTPRGLVAGLSGDGRLGFTKSTIYGLSPQALEAVAVEQGEGDKKNTKPEDMNLRALLAEELRGSDFPLEPFEIGFDVRNGTARFKKVALKSPSGHATVTSYLELARLKLDSEWLLIGRKSEAGGKAPQIKLIFAGSLFEFGRIKPDIDTQTLERYITMRRMEADVERLERLDVTGRTGPGLGPSVTPKRKPVPDRSAATAPNRRPETPATEPPVKPVPPPAPVQRAPSPPPAAPAQTAPVPSGGAETPPAASARATPVPPLRAPRARTAPAPATGAAPSVPAVPTRTRPAAPVPPGGPSVPAALPPASPSTSGTGAVRLPPPGQVTPFEPPRATGTEPQQPGAREQLPWLTQTQPTTPWPTAPGRTGQASIDGQLPPLPPLDVAPPSLATEPPPAAPRPPRSGPFGPSDIFDQFSD